MSNSAEQLKRAWQLYELDNNREPTALREVCDWAVKKGLLETPDVDPMDVLASSIQKALREDYRTDEFGRRYRANHAVRVTKAGVQHTLWALLDYAPRDFMEKAFAQRRKQIVDDCFQLKTDVDVYNHKNASAQPLQMELNFTEDVEELQALYQSDRDAA
jgi:hypothetical protein